MSFSQHICLTLWDSWLVLGFYERRSHEWGCRMNDSWTNGWSVGSGRRVVPWRIGSRHFSSPASALSAQFIACRQRIGSTLLAILLCFLGHQRCPRLLRWMSPKYYTLSTLHWFFQKLFFHFFRAYHASSVVSLPLSFFSLLSYTSHFILVSSPHPHSRVISVKVKVVGIKV